MKVAEALRTKASTLLAAIGALEVLGAGWSVVTLSQLLLRTEGAVVPWGFLLAFLAFFAIVGMGGTLLVRHRELGIPLSILGQVPQILQLTAGPLAYRAIAGYQASVFIVNERLGFFAGFTASVNFWRGDADPTFALAVNLIPLAFLTLLVLLPTPATFLASARRGGAGHE